MARKRRNGPSARGEFLRADHDVARLAVADRRTSVTSAPIRSSPSSRCRSSTPRTGTPSIATTRSSARRPARAAGESPMTSTTSTARVAADQRRDPRRQRPRAAGDADPRAAHAAVAHQGGDDPARGRVDRDRQAEADAGDRGVDADDSPGPSTSAPPELPGFSAASVWMTSSIMRVAVRSRAGSERPSAETTPGGHRAGVAVRVADRHDELADAQLRRVAQLGGGRGARRRGAAAPRSDSGSTPTTLRLHVASRR